MKVTERPFDVFLAHSSKDKPLIQQIYRKLKDRRLNPWSAQFDEVMFLYEVDESQIPMNAAQVQKAKDVIQFAKQKEGNSFTELLNTIYQVAPHLKR